MQSSLPEAGSVPPPSMPLLQPQAELRRAVTTPLGLPYVFLLETPVSFKVKVGLIVRRRSDEDIIPTLSSLPRGRF